MIGVRVVRRGPERSFIVFSVVSRRLPSLFPHIL